MGWKNNLTDKSEVDTDELAVSIVKELLAEDVIFGGEEWWLDEANDPREMLVSYQCGPKEEPIYAKQFRVKVSVEVVEIPDEVTLIQ